MTVTMTVCLAPLELLPHNRHVHHGGIDVDQAAARSLMLSLCRIHYKKCGVLLSEFLFSFFFLFEVLLMSM